MKKGKHIILFFLLLLAGKNTFAQFALVEKAMSLYSDKKLDSALIIINKTIKSSETSKNYQAWMMRGFIYKEFYKTTQTTNITSAYRDSAAVSLIECLQLDIQNKNSQKNNVLQSLKYLASTYHNDINKSLDTNGYKQALINSDKHRAIMKLIDPAFNENKYNYDVYSTVGSMFEKWYETTTSKTLLDLAKNYLLKAYAINNNTDFINKNLGVLYYNQAVDIIKKMDYDVPLDQLPIYQDNSVKLGKQALPYLLKASQINPTDKAVVEGLAGIYYLLNETDKYNEYKKRFEDMTK